MSEVISAFFEARTVHYVDKCVKGLKKELQELQDAPGDTGQDKLSAEDRAQRLDQEESAAKERAGRLFVPSVWIAAAIDRLSRSPVSAITHVPKFTHPRSQAEGLFAEADFRPDGLLRSGNVHGTQCDAKRAAQASDIASFMVLQLDNGKTVLECALTRDPFLKVAFDLDTALFEALCDAFSRCKAEVPRSTCNRLKQVYFLIGDDEYHGLTVLYPSSLALAASDRYRAERSSDSVKESKKLRKENELSDFPYRTWPGIVQQRFGGTQPQNISRLNTQLKAAPLLPSLPPIFDGSQVLPHYRRGYFRSLSRAAMKDSLHHLHKAFARLEKQENKDARLHRDKVLRIFLDRIFSDACRIQLERPGWSAEGKFSLMPPEEKVWLDAAAEADPVENWRGKIAARAAQFLIHAYEKSTAKPFFIGDSTRQHLETLAMEYLA